MLWSVARQTPLLIVKNTGVGLPRPPSGDLPDPAFKTASLTSPALAGRFFPGLAPPGKPLFLFKVEKYSVMCKYHVLSIHPSVAIWIVSMSWLLLMLPQ